MAPIKRLTSFWASAILTYGSLTFFPTGKAGFTACIRAELEMEVPGVPATRTGKQGERAADLFEQACPLGSGASHCLEHNAEKAREPVLLLSVKKHHSPVMATSVGMGQRSALASPVLHSCTRTFHNRLRYELESVWHILITRWKDHNLPWVPTATTGRSWPVGMCTPDVELGQPNTLAEKTRWLASQRFFNTCMCGSQFSL